MPMHRNWKNLASSYVELSRNNEQWRESHMAMEDICRYIASSFLRKSVFGLSLHHALFVSQSNYEFSAPPDVIFLKIEPLSNGGIDFINEDTKIKSRQWRREVIANNATQRFKSLVDQFGCSSATLSD